MIYSIMAEMNNTELVETFEPIAEALPLIIVVGVVLLIAAIAFGSGRR